MAETYKMELQYNQKQQLQLMCTVDRQCARQQTKHFMCSILSNPRNSPKNWAIIYLNFTLRKLNRDANKPAQGHTARK